MNESRSCVYLSVITARQRGPNAVMFLYSSDYNYTVEKITLGRALGSSMDLVKTKFDVMNNRTAVRAAFFQL